MGRENIRSPCPHMEHGKGPRQWKVHVCTASLCCRAQRATFAVGLSLLSAPTACAHALSALATRFPRHASSTPIHLVSTDAPQSRLCTHGTGWRLRMGLGHRSAETSGGSSMARLAKCWRDGARSVAARRWRRRHCCSSASSFSRSCWSMAMHCSMSGSISPESTPSSAKLLESRWSVQRLSL